MTPADIATACRNGTIFEILMQETDISSKEVDGKVQLQFVLPKWFEEHIPESLQKKIVEVLKTQTPSVVEEMQNNAR